MWEIEGVGTVELVHVGRLLRMGCDSLLMLVYVSDGGGEPLWEQNGLSWEHSVGNQWDGGGEERQRQRLFHFRNQSLTTKRPTY